MATFPGAIPSYSTMNPNQTLAVAGHTARHNEVQLDVAAIATKVGTAAATPSAGKVLRGNGAGSSTWGAVDLATDVTGKLPTNNIDLLAIMDTVYPIGSIYTSVVSTNPNTLFGTGTWQAFGQGAVPVGYNAADTDFNAPEKTGGEKTHALMTSEMPSHTHTQDAHKHNQTSGSSLTVSAGPNTGLAYDHFSNTLASNMDTASTTATNQNTGGNVGHNNLQPYIVVYMWKRVS